MNPHETINEGQPLFIRRKLRSVRGHSRIAIFRWPSLLALVLLLTHPNASFAQSALTDDASVNCSSHDDDNDGHESSSTNTGGGGNCGAKPSLSLSSSGKGLYQIQTLFDPAGKHARL